MDVVGEVTPLLESADLEGVLTRLDSINDFCQIQSYTLICVCIFISALFFFFVFKSLVGGRK